MSTFPSREAAQEENFSSGNPNKKRSTALLSDPALVEHEVRMANPLKAWLARSW